MDAPCEACSSGPSGFAGHPGLAVERLGDSRVSFRCTACDAFWSRTLEREGYFVWSPLTERMAGSAQLGIPVPPRSTSLQRPLPWRGPGASPWLGALGWSAPGPRGSR